MVVDPVGVEALDGRVLAQPPILVLARTAPAKPTVQGRLLLEVDRLHWGSLKSKGQVNGNFER